MDSCKAVAEKIEEQSAENEAAQAIIKKSGGKANQIHSQVATKIKVTDDEKKEEKKDDKKRRKERR